jgi:hypothetical protein
MVKMGTVWDRTAEFLTDNLPAILPIALFAYFVPFSVMGSLSPILDEANGLSAALWIVIFALVAVVNWGGLVLIAMALERAGDLRAEAARRLAPALALSVLMFGVILLLAMPPVLAIAASGGMQDAAFDIPIAVAWALALYCPLAIVAGMWIVARLLLINPVLVAERRWLGAFVRSWMLTRGAGLRIVGVMILYTVVAIVGVLATKTVFGTIFHLIAGAGDGLSLSNVLTSVMVAAAQTALSVIVPVFSAKLYLALSNAARA